MLYTPVGSRKVIPYDQGQNRRPPRLAGFHGAAYLGYSRSTTWLGHRAPHRADQPRRSGVKPGIAVPRPAAPAANGLDHFQVGRVRQQSARQVLRHHAHRQKTTRGRSGELGTSCRYPISLRKSGAGVVMTKMRVLFSRLSGLIRKGNLEPDLDEELDFHLQMEIAENVRVGMPPDQARSSALRRFGGVARAKETYRETHSLPFFQVLWQDLRYGLRMLRRSPGFSVLAILCLTLGIGSNAAVFSWIEGILLRPFPMVAHQDRMLAIAGWNRDVPGDPDVSWPDFQDFEKNCRLFDAFIVDRITGVTLAIGDKAEVARASIVSANYFDALGVRPILGRGFQPSENIGR